MSDLRVAVLGVGMMGADHVARITSRISGARVTVVNDYLTEKAEQIAAGIPGCRAIADPLDAIADPDVDAVVLATPGPDAREATAGLPRARQAGAVREAADHRRRDLARGRQARGRARHSG